MLDNSADKPEDQINENLEVKSVEEITMDVVEEGIEKTVDDVVIKKEDEQLSVEEVVKPTENVDPVDNEAVSEIENKVAEAAEKSAEKNTISMPEYDKMELEVLVKELQKLLKEYQVQQLKANVDAIKNAFNAKFGALLAEKKASFLEEGGNSIDFQYSNPIKTTYNELLSEYKIKRDTYYSGLDQQLKANLEKRHSVINELKELISNADTKTMYKVFKSLQTRWREIGPVPRDKYNDTWRNYQHHVERFYDLLHLSNDFRDLDFKHNLEEKLKLIERVKALAEREDINEMFKELQEFHKLWKEDIGPVSKEYREDIWKKFSAASKKIHDKRHLYYKELRSQYQGIIDKKRAVAVAIAAFDTSSNKKHSDWQKSIKVIEALRQEYFNAGKLPYSKSEEVWQEFKEATKKFNHSKNLFYKTEKSVQQANLDKKNALITHAESLKDSDDFETVTNTMKKIQSDWKKIGHVPRKFSDDIWKKFKSACNHYFDRLHSNQGEVNKEQLAFVEEKKAFLEEIKGMEKVSLERVKEAIKKWKDLGVLPKSEKYLDTKFSKTIDVLLGTLSLSKEEIILLKFKNLVDGYADQKNVYKLNSELQFIRKKVDEFSKEIQQLENNLSFFSNASEDNPLVKNVLKNISKYKEDMKIWKQKLDYLRKLDY